MISQYIFSFFIQMNLLIDFNYRADQITLFPYRGRILFSYRPPPRNVHLNIVQLVYQMQIKGPRNSLYHFSLMNIHELKYFSHDTSLKVLNYLRRKGLNGWCLLLFLFFFPTIQNTIRLSIMVIDHSLRKPNFENLFIC